MIFIKHRLHIDDHSVLHIKIPTELREIVEKSFGSNKHFIVLQHLDNNLFILIPRCALPRLLTMDGNNLSVQVLLDRRKNQEWIDSMGDIRFYLFPVHTPQA